MDDYDVNDYMGSATSCRRTSWRRAVRSASASRAWNSARACRRDGKTCRSSCSCSATGRRRACGRRRTRRAPRRVRVPDERLDRQGHRALLSTRACATRQGAKVGGIRIGFPTDDGGPVDFTSDLEGATDEAEQADPAKVPV